LGLHRAARRQEVGPRPRLRAYDARPFEERRLLVDGRSVLEDDRVDPGSPGDRAALRLDLRIAGNPLEVRSLLFGEDEAPVLGVAAARRGVEGVDRAAVPGDDDASGLIDRLVRERGLGSGSPVYLALRAVAD